MPDTDLPARSWQRAWDAQRVHHPRIDRALQQAWRRPLAVLLPVAAVVSALGVEDVRPYDLSWFIDGGRVLTSSRALEVFADEGLQMGPLYLLLVGVVARVAELVGLPVMALVGAVVAVVVVWTADVVARRWAALGGASAPAARWSVGGALVVGGILPQVSASGHQEEVLLAVVLAAAAASAATGRLGRVGVLLGVGAGVKAWAVLGGPIVLHGRSWRAAALGALTAVAGASVLYGPFLLFGDVRTFDFSWGIAGGPSALAALGAGLGLDDWGLRCLQAGAAAIAGAFVALRRGGTALAVVVTVVAVRLLLEPIASVYYLAPLVLLTVLWSATSPARPGPVARLVILALVPCTVLHHYLVPTTVSRTIEALTCVAVLGAVLLLERRRVRAADASPEPAQAVP